MLVCCHVIFCSIRSEHSRFQLLSATKKHALSFKYVGIFGLYCPSRRTLEVNCQLIPIRRFRPFVAHQYILKNRTQTTVSGKQEAQLKLNGECFCPVYLEHCCLKFQVTLLWRERFVPETLVTCDGWNN